MDKLWVKDVEVGQRASSIFLVAKKQQATGRNGKAFLKLTLQDKTGQLDARVWHDAETLGALFEQGDLVDAEGPIDSFQGKPQLTVERLQKADAEDRSDGKSHGQFKVEMRSDQGKPLPRRRRGRVITPLLR